MQKRPTHKKLVSFKMLTVITGRKRSHQQMKRIRHGFPVVFTTIRESIFPSFLCYRFVYYFKVLERGGRRRGKWEKWRILHPNGLQMASTVLDKVNVKSWDLHLRFARMWQEPKRLNFSHSFPRPTNSKLERKRSRLDSNWLSMLRCWHHKSWINLLCHNAGPFLLF